MYKNTLSVQIRNKHLDDMFDKCFQTAEYEIIWNRIVQLLMERPTCYECY